jgi:hypothetical protein
VRAAECERLPSSLNQPDWRITLANTVAASSMFWTGFWITVVAIFFLVFYRDRIAAFIDRTKKVGAGKWAAEADEQKSEQKIPPPVVNALVEGGGGKADPRAAADDLLAQLATTPYIRSREDILKRALAERGLDAASPETYRVLTAYTAQAFVIAECEKIYSTIWTTQIDILSQANTHELTDEELHNFHGLGAAASPPIYANHPFPEYLRFLTAQDLPVKTPAGKHVITIKGRVFLTYLVHEGRPLTGRVY